MEHRDDLGDYFDRLGRTFEEGIESFYQGGPEVFARLPVEVIEGFAEDLLLFLDPCSPTAAEEVFGCKSGGVRWGRRGLLRHYR